MGTYDHPSDSIRRISAPATDGLRTRDEWRVTAFPKRHADSTKALSVDREVDCDQIFYSLIVSGDRIAHRNSWTTIASAIFQSLLLAALAIIPLFRTAPLPKREWSTTVELSSPPVNVKPVAVQAPKSAPAFKPAKLASPAPPRLTTMAPPPPVAPVSDLAFGVADGDVSGALGDALTGTRGGPRVVLAATQAATPPLPKRIRVASGVAEANLIHDVPPVYPPEAGRERLEGTVVLLAVIGVDGAVKDVQVESGPALLTQAAIDAVKQWRYKPYLLNGVPVEIDSRITVIFTMSRG
jgi:periplasmic protein TonB